MFISNIAAKKQKREFYMGNINFDSYYKFSISLGIILVVLPISVIIFLFTDSFNLQISEADLATYTNTAQEVIKMKQSVPLLIYKWYVWLIAFIFFIAGIVLIVYGLFCWHNLQKLEDICKKRDAKMAMDVITKKIVEMSDEEIIQKNAVDVADEQFDQETTYLMQQRFFNHLKKTKNSHLLKTYIIIGTFEYDIIAFSQNFYDKDFVYEVKYQSKMSNKKEIEQYRNQMRNLRNNFSEKFSRIPYMVLVLIVADELHEHTLNIVDEIEKWNNYSIDVIRESELPEM